MRYAAVLLFIALSLPLSAAPGMQSAALSAKRSVVFLSVYSYSGGGRATLRKTGYGSGTIIGRNGEMVTNYHVVSKGEFYVATLSDGTECAFERINDAYFIGDPDTDIAVMRLDRSAGPFEPVRLAPAAAVSEGEDVIAIGSPYGLRHSVTAGIISSVGRFDLGFSEIEDFIQTDVPINPGNSGGPLVNMRGEMVGLNSAIRTVSGAYQGISFAIPSDMVARVAKDLFRYGRVKRGWLGIIIRDEAVGNARRTVRVISVTRGSPAERAGIQPGDIIRSVDGETIDSRGRMVRAVRARDIGETIDFVISRNGRLGRVALPYAEKQASPDSDRRLRTRYGFTVEPGTNGAAIVAAVHAPDTPVHPGDEIIAVNGAETPDITSFRTRINRTRDIRGIEVRRRGRSYYIDLAQSPETTEE